MKHFYLTTLFFFSISLSYSQYHPYFSEYAEGSSNNKYLEIYNPTDTTIDLTQYAYPSVANAPTTAGEHDFWNEFDSGASVAPGEVYVIMHGSFDSSKRGEADEDHTYLSNGDDGYALVYGTETSFTVVDVIGQNIFESSYADPGTGWDVAGVSNATKDHTLVRKPNISQGTTDWTTSAGSNAEDSQWVVYDSDTWDYVGSHSTTAAPLSINDLDLIEIDIYPNPADDKIYFKGLSDYANINILNLLGQTVLKANTKDYIDISTIEPSVYIIEISSDSDKVIRKFIKN